MIYVALLRGINVGGKAKVEMSRLKRVFEGVGCKNVITYINSGNVIFSHDDDVPELVQQLEEAIEKEFSLKLRLVLRDKNNIGLLCSKIALSWTNDLKQKTDVLFLWNEIDNSHILNKIVYNPEIENIRYIEGAIVWNIQRKDYRKGSSAKLIKNELYKSMTIRNINSVRKIRLLMDSV